MSYKIILPATEIVHLNQLEQRLYRANWLKTEGYNFEEVEEKKRWIIYTPQEKKYKVTYKDGKFRCTCPDAFSRAQKFANGWCKHKLFILTNIDIPEIMATVLLVDPFLAKYIKKV